MKIAIACLLLAGCASTLDLNYVQQLEAYRQAINTQAAVDMARAKAEEARYVAIAEVASRGGPQSQQLAIIALALSGRNADGSASTRPVVLPNIPETSEDKALRWATVFAGPTTALISGWYGYRLGVTQSNNAAATTTASYNAFGNMATTGYNALGATTLAGYGTLQNIAGGALGVATTGINTLPQLKPPVPTIPNMVLNGNGVIGGGSYVGDNSGAASGNTGTIRVLSPDTTRNCTGTTNPAGTTNPTGTASANC
jgi:hypothetical protein